MLTLFTGICEKFSHPMVVDYLCVRNKHKMDVAMGAYKGKVSNSHIIKYENKQWAGGLFLWCNLSFKQWKFHYFAIRNVSLNCP